jgi:hypothetical protein
LRQVKAQDHIIAGFLHLRRDFLLDQLVSRHPLRLGGVFKNLLLDQGIEGFPFDVVFLAAQRLELPLN